MASRTYDDLSKDELIRLLQSRDRRDATRYGLVWEANEIERDAKLNADFVALDLDPALSEGTDGAEPGKGTGPWKNLIIEGDNFDALRYPDFILGVQGRPTKDGGLLADTKYAFETRKELPKMLAEHGDYGRVLILSLEGKRWCIAKTDAGGRAMLGEEFRVVNAPG